MHTQKLVRYTGLKYDRNHPEKVQKPVGGVTVASSNFIVHSASQTTLRDGLTDHISGLYIRI